MIPDSLTEREAALLQLIGACPHLTQRDAARRLRLAVGTVHLLVHRLISAGYVRLDREGARQTRYSLTEKGWGMRIALAMRDTAGVLQSVARIKGRIREVLERYYLAGVREFRLYGETDLAGLAEMALREGGFHGIRIRRSSAQDRFRESGAAPGDAVRVDCGHETAGNASPGTVHLITELAAPQAVGACREAVR